LISIKKEIAIRKQPPIANRRNVSTVIVLPSDFAFIVFTFKVSLILKVFILQMGSFQSRDLRGMTHNGPAIKCVNVAERVEAVG
jgi:hypothetical protein